MKTLSCAEVAASGRAIADVIGDAFCAVECDQFPTPITNGAADVGDQPPTSSGDGFNVVGDQLSFADLPQTFGEMLAQDERTIARYHLRERFTGNRACDAATLAANNARKKKPK